MAVLLAQIVS